MLHGQAQLIYYLHIDATAKIKEHELSLDIVCCCVCVPLISAVFIEVLSPLFSPPFPLTIPISFPLEGKKNKIRILEIVSVSVEN